MSNTKFLLSLLCFILCLGGCTLVKINGSKDFPRYPIKLIVPFSAGGGLDMQARLFEKFASQRLKQPLVVTNKSGAAGVIGWNELAHAKPDGYTLGMTGIATLLHSLYHPDKTHYLSTIEPIAQISSSPCVLVVNAKQPWNNVHELIDFGKRHPQKLKCGNSGIGSFVYILTETFAQETNLKIIQVPFQGGSESVAALLSNHIQFAFINSAIVKEHIKAGTLKAIAVSNEKRLNDPFFADVPTLKEQGIDITLTNWFGIGAPKGLPPEIKTAIEEGLKEAAADPEFKEYMAKAGMEIEYLDSEQSHHKWVREMETLKKTLDSTDLLDEVRSYQQ